jgi:prepilin-type N-terminal cleavage/methylation domain-containing protein
LGFTLVELLVVIFIIGVLLLLLLPAVQKVREVANRQKCANNLKQMGLALHGYHHDQGSFPSAYLYNPAGAPTSWEPPHYVYTSPGWGWASLLLPYLEQEPLARRIQYDVAVEDDRHEAVRTTVLRIFECPSDRSTGVFQVLNEVDEPLARAATNSYAACFGSGGDIGERPDKGNGIFCRNSAVPISKITDGTSTTLAVGERAALFCQTPWAGAMSGGTARITPGAPVEGNVIEEAPVQVMASMRGWPLNSPYSTPYDFFSPHGVVVQFLFADGSVRPLSTKTNGDVLQALATYAGGEVIPGD